MSASTEHKELERQIDQNVTAALVALENLKNLADTASGLVNTDEAVDLANVAMMSLKVIAKRLAETVKQWKELPSWRGILWRRSLQAEMDFAVENGADRG